MRATPAAVLVLLLIAAAPAEAAPPPPPLPLDSSPPVISATFPADGAIAVAATSLIQVTFNESMDDASFTYSITPDPGGVSPLWSSNNTVLTFLHSPFPSGALHQVYIANAFDVAGNPLAAGPVANPFEFVIADTVAPELVAAFPANGSTGIGTTGPIQVTFTEKMNTSSFSYSVIPDPGGLSLSWSSGDTVATIAHAPFATETRYDVAVSGAMDLAGNPLLPGAVPNPFTFSTLDATGPVLMSTSPQNGSSATAGAAVTAAFDEPLDPGSVSITSNPNPGGWIASFNPGNTQVTWTHAPFSEGATYTITVDALDPAGNGISPSGAPNPFTFTVSDSNMPSVLSSTPSAGSLAYPGDPVSIAFSEAMNASSVTLSASPDPGGWVVSWSSGGSVATFSHAPFPEGVSVTIAVAGMDLAGRALAAGAAPNPFTFSVKDITAPRILASIPANGSSSTLPANPISVTFSESMNASSVSLSASPDPGGWSVSWSAGNSVASWTHAPLAERGTYLISIAGLDPGGNTLAAGPATNPFTFTVADATPPFLKSVSPQNGSSILPSADIVLEFSEPMEVSSVVASASPAPASWSLAWAAGGRIATYSHSPFPERAVVTLTAGGTDPAGNSLGPGPVPFPLTYLVADATSPALFSTAPLDLAKEVPLAAPVVLTFTEPVNQDQLGYVSVPDPGGWSLAWSNGDRIVTLTHSPFAPGTLHTFQVTQAADVAGNLLAAGPAPNPFTFITTVPPDTVAPAIAVSSPLNGSLAAPGSSVQVTFTEPMDIASVSIASVPDPGGWSVSWNSQSTTATFVHSPFQQSVSHTITVSGGDLSSNPLAAGAVPNPFTFTVLDVTPPSVASYSPSPGAAVAPTAPLVVTFSEPVDPATATLASTPDPGGWTATWSSGNRTATWKHAQFAERTGYSVAFGARDAAGNPLAPAPGVNPLNFTVLDVTAPRVVSTSPASGGTAAATSPVAVAFNEMMNASSLSVSATPDPGGWSAAWSAGDTVATLQHNPFAEQQTYSVTLTASDSGGNALAGGGQYTFSFGVRDLTAPALLSTSPSNGSVVPAAAAVTAMFSEPMNISTVRLSASPDPGGWSVAWSAGDTVATWTHAPFNESLAYSILLAGNDTAGVPLAAGPGNPFTFRVADATPPTIAATSPSDGGSAGASQPVVASFSEAMDPSAVSLVATPDPGGWNVSWDAGFETATWTHSPFSPGISYSIRILGKDAAGNLLAAGPAKNPFAFRAEDVAPPLILSTHPANGSLHDPSAALVLAFSEPMNASSVSLTTSPDPGGWAANWSADLTVATFSHSPFPQGSSVAATVTGSDAAGNRLAAGGAPNPFSFRTADLTRPRIVAAFPAAGAGRVESGTPVVLSFSEAMEPASAMVSLSPDPGGVAWSWSNGETELTIGHDPLAPATSYTVHLSGARDTSGNALEPGPVPNPWNFTTVPAQPKLAAVTIIPASVTVESGSPFKFDALGWDDRGRAVSVAVSWAVSGGGSISQDGTFTPSLPGNWTVYANASGLSGVAKVRVTPAPQEERGRTDATLTLASTLGLLALLLAGAALIAALRKSRGAYEAPREPIRQRGKVRHEEAGSEEEDQEAAEDEEDRAPGRPLKAKSRD
jgi:hypothetical protein